MAQCAFADQKERGFCVVALEDVQHLTREFGMRAIVEGKSDERKFDAHAIENVWSEAFENREDEQGLKPKNKEGCRLKSDGDQEKSEAEGHGLRPRPLKNTRFPECRIDDLESGQSRAAEIGQKGLPAAVQKGGRVLGGVLMNSVAISLQVLRDCYPQTLISNLGHGGDS